MKDQPFDPRDHEAFVREIDPLAYESAVASLPRGVIPRRRGMTWRENLAAEMDLMPSVSTNKLLNTIPTLCVQPYNHPGTAQYATTLAGTAAVAKDDEILDPTTGLSTCKLTLGVGDDATQTIRWDGLSSSWSMGPDDVYLLAVHLGTSYLTSDNMYMRLRITNQGTPSTVYRFCNMFGGAFHQGWNIIAIKNTEIGVGASEYGVLGTVVASQVAWSTTGGMPDDATINGVRLEIINGAGLQINIGSLHRAPAGWCKAVVIWSEDDGWKNFYDLGRPIIESYGWPITHNLITSDRSDGGFQPVADAQWHCAREGHEVRFRPQTRGQGHDGADHCAGVHARRDAVIQGCLIAVQQATH